MGSKRATVGVHSTACIVTSAAFVSLQVQRCWEAAHRSSEASTSGRCDDFDDGDCHDDTLTPLPSATSSDTFEGGALPGLRPTDFDFNSYVNQHYLPNFSQQQRIEDLKEVKPLGQQPMYL